MTERCGAVDSVFGRCTSDALGHLFVGVHTFEKLQMDPSDCLPRPHSAIDCTSDDLAEHVERADLRSRLQALVEEHERSVQPAPYTSERALIERLRGILDCASDE